MVGRHGVEPVLDPGAVHAHASLADSRGLPPPPPPDGASPAATMMDERRRPSGGVPPVHSSTSSGNSRLENRRSNASPATRAAAPE